jgi:hypothetical protein
MQDLQRFQKCAADWQPGWLLLQLLFNTALQLLQYPVLPCISGVK